jgi:hypothetical protein
MKQFYLVISMDIGLTNILGQMILHGQIKWYDYMDLYKGQINEFVDWVTGTSSLTGNNVTEGL